MYGVYRILLALAAIQGLDDNMSNLTSAAISNEASISSSNNNMNEMANSAAAAAINVYPHQNLHSFASPIISNTNNNNNQLPQPAVPTKKRRNLPGHPDPDAEVVALTPRSLMATNRFVCEICNKGFQRDQNLQLHRRGHNLPWKLKQRNKLEVVKKKVYVCPEPSCVHHEPARALGDLTGIKKHYSRKHGEKKWKCDKCSKRYAVQSDWKAHSKICGTREYRCDCGTLFSRRDSFITHRAFCDALAQESSKSIPQPNPLFLPIQTPPNNNNNNNTQFPHQIHTLNFNNNNTTLFPHHHHHHQLKQENLISLPTWLSSPNDSPRAEPSFHHSAPNTSIAPSLMSATALLQKAAQMGVTMSGGGGKAAAPMEGGGTAGLGRFVHVGPSGCMQQQIHNAEMVSSSLPSTGFGGSGLGFEDGFSEILDAERRSAMSGFRENAIRLIMGLGKEATAGGTGAGGSGGSGGGAAGDGLTRDFLGLRGYPDDRDFLNMAGLEQMGPAGPYDQHHQLARLPRRGIWYQSPQEQLARLPRRANIPRFTPRLHHVTDKGVPKVPASHRGTQHAAASATSRAQRPRAMVPRSEGKPCRVRDDAPRREGRPCSAHASAPRREASSCRAATPATHLSQRSSRVTPVP
ncbi:Protein indeterminate-domain 7 [Striga hermonthica]|uniref:Protein indeterminate-domain 7 n=1 Tax=Striga hermonthica TaxID=68872 RepID=A0A9N7P3D4_STRHE|nr:Protein indeterminate-domain 7 [Striga hermonthica]